MGAIDPTCARSTDLLRAMGWHAERLLKKRGQIYGVIWLTQTESGRRQLFETQCDYAPADASNTVLLAKLVAELREDFASTGVTQFACAYSADRITTNRSTRAELHTDIVTVEVHSSEGEHIRTEREILSVGGRFTLAAMSELQSAGGSKYAGILQVAS